MNLILPACASVLQEFMVRSIRKSFGVISNVLFLLSVPLTFYNIMFSDPAPYFTLCLFGCFSVEPCYTNDQNLGSLVSLCLIFGLCFLLSAETLAISFNLKFIGFNDEQIQILVIEVKKTFKSKKKNKKEDEHDEDDDDEDDDNQHDKTNEKNNEKDDSDNQIEGNSEKNEDEDPVNLFTLKAAINRNMIDQKLQNEFANVKITMRPIDYFKVK